MPISDSAIKGIVIGGFIFNLINVPLMHTITHSKISTLEDKVNKLARENKRELESIQQKLDKLLGNKK
jgi:hypothetical protein